MKIYIGIDPGVNTGVAVWIPDAKRFTLLATKQFWDAIEIIRESNSRPGVVLSVVIEDPSKNKPTFLRNTTDRGMNRISRNVGANCRDARLIVEYCNRNGINVEAVRPSKKTMTKLDADTFCKLTGWTGTCSQHSRDAAMLVWGRM